jgi:hypothetical protein
MRCCRTTSPTCLLSRRRPAENLRCRTDLSGRHGGAQQAGLDHVCLAGGGQWPVQTGKTGAAPAAILAKNPDYWNKDRIPRVDKVVLIPAGSNARTAALLSKQVDWIEAPAPDAVDQIKAQGFKIYANTQPHVWPWQFSFLKVHRGATFACAKPPTCA